MLIFSFLYHFIWKLIELSCADLEEDGGLGSHTPPPEFFFGSAQDCVFFFYYGAMANVPRILYMLPNSKGSLHWMGRWMAYLIHFSANYAAVLLTVFWCDKQCKNGNSNNCVCKSEVQTLHSLIFKKKKTCNLFPGKIFTKFWFYCYPNYM